MKRICKSMLVGLLCLACLPVIPTEASAARGSYTMIVAGVAENGDSILLLGSEALSLGGEKIAAALPEESDRLAPGDIIRFREGVYYEQTALGGNVVNSMGIFALDDQGKAYLEHGMIVKEGSILENMETAVYTAGGEAYGLELYEGEVSEDARPYRMINSWQSGNRYEQLGNVNWADVEPGDTLECIVYNGRPVIALDVVSTTLNEDGESDYDYEYWGEYRSVYRIYTDAFKYTNHGYHTEKNLTSAVYYKNGFLRTGAVNANCLVTGVFYAPGETKPAYYTVNAIGSGVHFEHSANVNAAELERYLGDQILEIGDLLFMKTVWQEGDMPEDVVFNHLETTGVESVVEYAGNGMELFGEDFRKVLRHELNKTPVLREGRSNYRADTACDVFEKGKITDDDEIDLIDVITLNRYLMIGSELNYISRLAADVNNDGKVTSADALHILRKVVGLIDSFEEVQN